MSKKISELSIFLPAYNEAGNIEEAINQALNIAPKVASIFEIIVINDGSKDATRQIVKRITEKHKEVRLISQRNKGYGGAVKKGFKSAKYEWVFFTDSDLQFDMYELPKLINKTDKNDLIIGYRLSRAEGRKRAFLASLLKLWNHLLLGFPEEIKDIDCAFKLIHRSVIKNSEPLVSDGAMVSTEFLLKAHRAGFRIVQVGVHHYQRMSGKPTGNSFTVILKAIYDTFILRYLFTKKAVNTFFYTAYNFIQ